MRPSPSDGAMRAIAIACAAAIGASAAPAPDSARKVVQAPAECRVFKQIRRTGTHAQGGVTAIVEMSGWVTLPGYPRKAAC